MGFWHRLFGRQPDFTVDKQQLKEYLSETCSILEAGVCDGDDTEAFATIFPNGHIHGFECVPHYQEVAQKRLEKYSNVTLYPYALSDTSGEVDFHVSTLNGHSFGSGSLLSPKLHKEVHPNILFESTIKVTTTTIDEWAQKYDIDKIDFLWLDLQGAEIKALRGAERILKNVKGIFTEVSLIETYEQVPLYEEVKSFLMARNFKVHKEYLPYKDMGNVLFLR